jgi:16S rRNA G966 N2-methylase RsmD
VMLTMGLQTMSNIAPVIPQEVFVTRTDPVYMAHAYLTKVPVAAIEPFIEAFTKPGDTVVDPFAGSGMTGVAAAATGRRALLFDISVLGRHIGTNYTNLVNPTDLQKAAADVLAQVRRRLGGDVYAVRCAACAEPATLTKRVWSAVVQCAACGSPVNYYRAFEAADWHKSKMACPACGAAVSSRCERIDEEAVLDSITCACSKTQQDQAPSEPLLQFDAGAFTGPAVDITPDRQMYKAQALAKSGRTTIASYYAPRNLAFLTVLHEAINTVEDEAIRRKLQFVFTAILTRASKRYQWSIQRPLNAANANYYVAPVFYEWNVPDLFARKVEAAIRSDDWIRDRRDAWAETLFEDNAPAVEYGIATAEALPLPDASVDYVFTDPPFGSNLFYADMALFQEAWLGTFTDHRLEAVIDRGARKARGASRYENLLAAALAECRRIVRPGGWITMVFGNSSGAVWALVQRAVQQAGLAIDADTVAILNKGQRSVKGLASGFEHVATMDLIMSMQPVDPDVAARPLHSPDARELKEATASLLGQAKADSPSHLYLELLRHGIRAGWELSAVDLRTVTPTVQAMGWQIHSGSGKFARSEVA